MSQGDVVSTNPSYSFTVDGNTNLYARFAPVSNESRTVSSHPTSYDEVYTAYTVSSPSTGYADSTNTSYSSITITRAGSGSVTEFFYNFNLNIPSGATINSVSCTAKCYISNTSYTSTHEVQLFSGRSKAKGDPHTLSTSTTAFTMTAGDWTADELNNAKIRLYSVANTSTSGANVYLRFYGATLTVSYTYNHATMSVNARSEVNNVTITPTTVTPESIVDEGGLLPTKDTLFTLSCSSMSGYKLTDNGTNVTSGVTAQNSSSFSSIPARWTNDTSASYTFGTTTSTYYIYNAYNNSNNTGTAARLSIAKSNSSRTFMGWFFIDTTPLESIPSNATITSVKWNVKYYVSSSTYISAISLQLYTGSGLASASCTAKGTAQTAKPTSTSGQRYTNIDGGNWTLEELENLKLHVSATKSTSNNTSYVYFYGADVVVSYTIPTTYKTGIAGDHTLILSAS